MKRKTVQQEFGGLWTEQKLRLLRDYLESYMVIFRRYPNLNPVYIDAFAGTGDIPPKVYGSEDNISDQDLTVKGSPRVALEVSDPTFGHFIFVEKSRAKCRELENLKEEYPTRASRIEVVNQDASEFLTNWCQAIDRRITRAVVFLDPFGMQVEWSLLETLAETRVIDLWLLVPLWMGPNRLLTKDDLPPEIWGEKLTKFFGTDEWRERFYRPRVQRDLFDESSKLEKSVYHDGLRDYFLERLRTIFPGVAGNPVTQKNSTNSPMFLLCFATANPKESTKQAAINIAEHLLKGA